MQKSHNFRRLPDDLDEPESKRARNPQPKPHPGKDASQEQLLQWYRESVEIMRGKLCYRYEQKENLLAQIDTLKDRLKRREGDSAAIARDYERMLVEFRQLQDKVAAADEEINRLRRDLSVKDTEIYTMQQMMQQCHPQQLHEAQQLNKRFEAEIARLRQSLSDIVYNPVALQQLQKDAILMPMRQAVQRAEYERDQANRRYADLAAEIAQLKAQVNSKEIELRKSGDELRAATARLRSGGNLYESGAATAQAQMRVQGLEAELEQTKTKLTAAELRVRDLETTRYQHMTPRQQKPRGFSDK